MLRSMTAYGRGEAESQECRMVAEMQSVNRKFFDLNLYLPKELTCFDPDVRKWVGAAVARGQVTVRISALFNALPGHIRANLSLAKEMKSAWEQIVRELGLRDQEFRVETLIGLPNILVSDDNWQRGEPLRDLLYRAVDTALQNLLNMKEAEGAALERDISERLAHLQTLIESIAPLTHTSVNKYREKLLLRLQEIAPEMQDTRVLQEVALFAERSDIEEEITRFRSHLAQFKKILQGPGPHGKTLEFLVQELFRETNTLSAKASDLKIVEYALEIKLTLERIREQIQNIE